MALINRATNTLSNILRYSNSIRLASTSLNTINDKIQQKKESAFLGGGEKRIKSQHKKVCLFHYVGTGMDKYCPVLFMLYINIYQII